MLRSFTIAASLAVAILSGRVLDRTTGQGLPHVAVEAGSAHATTDASGRFALRGVKRGTLDVTLKSDDVPTQHYTITVGAGATRHDFRACSTTLDYNCGAPAHPDSGGASAG